MVDFNIKSLNCNILQIVEYHYQSSIKFKLNEIEIPILMEKLFDISFASSRLG